MDNIISPETEEFVLSDDQQAALDSFFAFLRDPKQIVFVLEGYSGTGKSTLIKTLMDRLPGYVKMQQLVNPSFRELELCLTATTNKAAETFSHITGMHAVTIHSHLGLRVSTDYSTGRSTLIPREREPVENQLLFIDEASMIDSALLDLIFKKTHNCKVVFIGDRAQLAPVNSATTPVFHAGFNGAMLSKVMRQAEGNPIIELATMFRNVVNGAQWGSFIPDGKAIQHLSRHEFEAKIIEEFTRPDWHYRDSKILAWRNECVIMYNNEVSALLKGDPEFQVGDYAVNNKNVIQGRLSIKTDQMVHITEIGPDEEEYGVLGNMVTIDYRCAFFFPKTLAAKNLRIKQAKAEDDYPVLRDIDETWIDLRAAFAQTINKSQGSTYDKVFIDLDDLRRCTNGNTLARLMYVASSRARHNVYLTGDLV